MISFTFDDGLGTTRSIAAPILRRHGMVATVGAICNRVFWDRPSRDAFMSADDLRDLAEAGWQIASHSLFHRRMCSLPPSYANEITTWRYDGAARAWIGECPWEDVGTIVYGDRCLKRAKSAAELETMADGFLIMPEHAAVYVKTAQKDFATARLRGLPKMN